MEAASTSTAFPNQVEDNTNQHDDNCHRSVDSSDNTVDGKHHRNRDLDFSYPSIDCNNSDEGGGSERGTSNGGGAGVGRSVSEERNMFEFFGWVYHVGINSIGHEYCHLRFLFIRGRYIHMYKRDPHEHPGIKPIRKGVIGPTLMVEERGRRNINNRDLYELRFYNRLDQSKKGEIACANAGEARKWMEAFDHAKQQVEYELSNSSRTRDKLNAETEINLDGHRPRVRRYAHGLRRLIRIGQGPESLLRQPLNLATDLFDGEGDGSDAIEPHEWKCVRTVNGVRILEDLSNQKSGKGVLVKSVGVIDAVADTVFEVLLNLEKLQRYEWDMLTADLELVDSYDGHYDVVYGRYDPKYLTRWNSKQDFVFSRQWFHGQDGTYTILQFPATHKEKPPRSGYRRSKIIPSTWEIRNLNSPMGSNCPRCLVTHTLEIHTDGWSGWKNNTSSKFEKSIPYALLSQVSGLKEYIGANPALHHQLATTISGSVPLSIPEDDSDLQDEFYDAIAAESSSSSDEDNEDDDNDDGNLDKKGAKLKLKNVSLAIRGLALKRTKASDTKNELDLGVSPLSLDFSQAHGSLHKRKNENDTNCWSSPSGTGFMIRGKSYLKDNSKVVGGDPLLKLVSVDWFKVDKAVDHIALNHNCLVQSDEGKKLPFILVVNLQVPAKPNYSLVMYYAADRPINKDSLLSKFVDGTDMFRNSRLKLIPSIVEGYWMVKRAVGTKACLLGKALTCRYLRQDNFLEIDVDIGSSSVARSVIGLVMGYVTSIVVDLAILIEGKEEKELPEYILGTVRLNRIRLDSAVPL